MKTEAALCSCFVLSVLCSNLSVLGADNKNPLGGRSLPDGWTWKRENPEAWRLRNQGLEIKIEPGNMWGGKNDAKNVLLIPLAEDHMRLVIPASQAPPPGEGEVPDLPFIAYPAGSTTRGLVETALARAAIRVRSSMEIGRPDVMIRLVEAGVGLSVLPASIVSAAEGRGRVCGLHPKGFSLVRRLGLLLPPGNVEPMASAFRAVLVPLPPA